MKLTRSEIILHSADARLESLPGEGREPKLGSIHDGNPVLDLAWNEHILDNIVKDIDNALNHIIHILASPFTLTIVFTSLAFQMSKGR